jgi:hypothetical protein
MPGLAGIDATWVALRLRARRVQVLNRREETGNAVIDYEHEQHGWHEDTGPFDVIGDVHGCRSELEELLGELGYNLRRDDHDRAVDAEHPAGRRARRPGAAEAPVRRSRWCGAWHAGSRDGVRIGPTRIRGEVTRKGVGGLPLRCVRGGT